jgi:hypothetical protein
MLSDRVVTGHFFIRLTYQTIYGNDKIVSAHG